MSLIPFSWKKVFCGFAARAASGWLVVALVAIGVSGSSAYAGAKRKPSVLVMHAELNPAWVADVQSKVSSSGQFAAVDAFNANSATPTLAQMLPYDAVLLFSDFSFANSTALGNNLADYVDAGGGVVNMVFSLALTSPPGGRWNPDYLSMAAGAPFVSGSPATLEPLSITDQNHAIMIGVTSFSGGSNSYRASQNNVVGGATVVARWTGGNVLVSAGPLPGRADLNFFPPSSAVRSDLWDQSTDGVKLMVNALLYTMRPRVLVAGAEADPAWIADVRTKVRGTGLVGITDTFNTSLGTPTLAQLRSYDAVLAWTDTSPQNSAALGNVLADYVDAGGGVVAATFAQSISWRITGRWENTYELISAFGTSTSGISSLASVTYPSHPAMSGVTSFNGGSSSFRPAGSTLRVNAFNIAQWSDGKPLVVASTRLPNRMDLGFFPPSSTVRSDFWNASTDGAKLMANALLYTVKPYIAVAPADSGSFVSDVVNKLNATRRFSGIGTFNLNLANPGSAPLLPFGALVTWTNFGYVDPNAIGSALADYVDTGGGVVVSLLANVSGSTNSNPLGRWSSQGYEICPTATLPGRTLSGPLAGLGSIIEPTHPIASFVRRFDGGTASYRATSNPLLRGRAIMNWSDGIVLASAHNFRKRADLGYFPASSGSSLGASAWNQRTDGTWMMANALEFVVRAKPCPGDFNGDGVVEDTDFVLFAGYYDALVDPRGDLNGDGLTEDVDFVIFAGGYDALVCP